MEVGIGGGSRCTTVCARCIGGRDGLPRLPMPLPPAPKPRFEGQPFWLKEVTPLSMLDTESIMSVDDRLDFGDEGTEPVLKHTSYY